MLGFELDEHMYANTKMIHRNMEENFTGAKFEEFNNDKCFAFSNSDQMIQNINIDSKKNIISIKDLEWFYRSIIQQIEIDKTNLKQRLQ